MRTRISCMVFVRVFGVPPNPKPFHAGNQPLFMLPVRFGLL